MHLVTSAVIIWLEIKSVLGFDAKGKTSSPTWNGLAQGQSLKHQSLHGGLHRAAGQVPRGCPPADMRADLQHG